MMVPSMNVAAVLGTTVLLMTVFAVSASASDSSMPELDLNKANIQPKLSALPATDNVLIEFFASWCPACRAFKPEYEKAATFLLKHSKVWVFRLDCAADPDVCDKYKVSGYPTMYVGKASDVAAVAMDKLSKFEYSLFKRDSAGVVQFVSKHTGLSLVYTEEAAGAAGPPDAATAGSNTSVTSAASAKTSPWTPGDIEAATRQLFTSITGFHPTDGLKERRAALVLLLKSWAAGHPVQSCRDGSAALMKQLPRLWPEDAARDPWGQGQQGLAQLKAPLDVCGGGTATTAAAAPYVSCKGSKPDSRGFTCGLWLLFHTTAARLPEKDGGALLVAALQGFAKYFFQCEVCKKHFIQVTTTPAAAAVRSRRDGVLWLWRSHNEVNARLQQVESKYGHSSTGDPAYPKVQWPTPADCPLCRLPPLPSDGAAPAIGSSRVSAGTSTETRWNEDEVYRFLASWYGRQASSSSTVAPARLQDASGGSAVMQAALEAVETQQRGTVLSFFTGKGGLLLVLAAGVVLLLRRQLAGGSSNGRRHPGVKGPGVAAYRHRQGQFIPRHGPAMVHN